MKKNFYVAYLYPKETFEYKGKQYTVLQHEANMTEVYDHKAGRNLAFWCWTKI